MAHDVRVRPAIEWDARIKGRGGVGEAGRRLSTRVPPAGGGQAGSQVRAPAVAETRLPGVPLDPLCSESAKT